MSPPSSATSYFNPRLPRGRRLMPPALPPESGNFNPRLPRGRRQGRSARCDTCSLFQSTSPSREATQTEYGMPDAVPISIHVSLAGGDEVKDALKRFRAISIHVSLAGGDDGHWSSNPTYKAFQSTSPSREATPMGGRTLSCSSFQSTSPSREATFIVPSSDAIYNISIHVSLAGGDAGGRGSARRRQHFNPRLPRGRRQGPRYGLDRS